MLLSGRETPAAPGTRQGPDTPGALVVAAGTASEQAVEGPGEKPADPLPLPAPPAEVSVQFAIPAQAVLSDKDRRNPPLAELPAFFKE